MSKRTIHNEMRKLSKRFKADLKRYKQLKSLVHTPASCTAESIHFIDIENVETVEQCNLLPWEHLSQSDEYEDDSTVEEETSDDSFICYENDNEGINENLEDRNIVPSELASELKKWALENKISHKSLTELLIILHRYNFTSLYASSRLKSSYSDNKPFLTEESHDDTTTNFLNQILNKVNSIEDINKNIEKKVNNIENNLKDLKEQIDSDLADKSLIKANLIYSKKTVDMLKNITGEDTDVLEIESCFPIKTVRELLNIEDKIKNENFCQKLIMYLRRFNQCYGGIDMAFKHIGTDEFYSEFNVRGVSGKRSLNSLLLISKILFEACGKAKGTLEFEKELKKSVLKSHNRFYKSKSLAQLKS